MTLHQAAERCRSIEPVIGAFDQPTLQGCALEECHDVQLGKLASGRYAVDGATPRWAVRIAAIACGAVEIAIRRQQQLAEGIGAFIVREMMERGEGACRRIDCE